MDTANSQKKSPRNSARNERNNLEMDQPTSQRGPVTELDCEQYLDRSIDLVARVRAAKEAAQRQIEAFGDVSEYEITKIYGQKKDQRQDGNAESGERQSSFAFKAQNSTKLPPGEEH